MAVRFEVETMARALMDKHGLSNWEFGFNNGKRTLGLCKHNKKRIELSWPIMDLNDIDVAYDVMLHEIAHALVDVGHGHNQVWKDKCIAIGAKPERCHSDPDTIFPKGRFVYECEKCGEEHTFFKKTINTYSCDKCNKYRGYDPTRKLIFKKEMAR